MGRPKKSREDRSSASLHLRLKPHEKKILLELAEMSGLDASKYLRNLVLRSLGVITLAPKQSA